MKYNNCTVHPSISTDKDDPTWKLWDQARELLGEGGEE